MRHYEIVLMVHPDQSAQVPAMVERYQSMVTEAGGTIHRCEDWGRRQMAYPINKVHKSHYYLMNLECGQETLDELENTFRYNDAIIRNLVLRVPDAFTEQTPIMKGSGDKGKQVERKPKSEEPDKKVEQKEDVTVDQSES